MAELRRRLLLLIPILVVALGLALVFSGQVAPAQVSGRVKAAVSVAPYLEFVKKVGGERVDVVVLVPPNADPHTFDLTPSVIQAVSDAEIYFKVGSALEFEVNWLGKLVELNPKMVVVDTSVGIPLIGVGSHTDPHIWLSPRNAVLIVESIYRGLLQVDPSGAETYRRNKEAYVDELKKLDGEVNAILSHVRTRVFVVYHSAWAYFARDYNLTQVALEEEGKEPTIGEMVEVLRAAKSEGVKAVFAEPLFDPREMQAVAEELGVKVILVDTHSFTDYVNHIRGFALNLREVLG